MNQLQTEAIAYGLVIAFIAYRLGQGKRQAATTTTTASAEAQADPLAWLGSWAQL